MVLSVLGEAVVAIAVVKASLVTAVVTTVVSVVVTSHATVAKIEHLLVKKNDFNKTIKANRKLISVYATSPNCTCR